MLYLLLSLAIYRAIMIADSNIFYSCGWPQVDWNVNWLMDCREPSCLARAPIGKCRMIDGRFRTLTLSQLHLVLTYNEIRNFVSCGPKV
jgi:hypothetical protein